MTEDSLPYPWEKPKPLRVEAAFQEEEWKCPNGHKWKQIGSPTQWRVMDKDAPRDTGPLCPFCIADFLERNFPAFRVKDLHRGEG